MKIGNSHALSDHLELWGCEEECLLFSDGSLGFGLLVTPLDVSCSSDDETNAVAQRAIQFLNGLSSGLDIQFVQDISGGNGAVISAHEELGRNAKNAAVVSLAKVRAERFRSYDSQGLVPKHSLYVFVRRPLTLALVDKPKLFGKKQQYPELADARLLRELTLLEQLRESVTQGLASIGLETNSLTAEEILHLTYWQWNPTRPVALGKYDPEDIRSSLLLTDVAIYEKGFALSDMHHRVLSLKILPDQTYASMAAELRNLPFDSRLFLSIHVPDQTKELESLQTSRRIAFSMVRGKKGVSDLESEAKLQDLETLLEQMISQGEKVFHVSINILLRSRSSEELEDKISQTLMLFRNLGGAEAMEESLAAFNIFSEFSIPNARSKERSKRIKSSNLADLLPLYGPWNGFQKPSVLLRSRHGSLIGFDPFDSGLANSNQLISGGSGSGKSFLTNVLLLHMLKENPKLYFVDIGGSYKKLCENLSGQYLPLGVNSGLSLNPFDLGPGETTVSSQKIKFLVGLIELMTKEDDEPRLPKLERAEIEEAIQKVYETSKSPKLSDLRNVLLAHPDTEIKRYGRILTPWCGDTPYGQFVDRATNIELNNPIVAFDLKGMESYPDLQAVCLFIITDFVWREVQRDRFQMKFLVFDECWKLLKSESGMVFIEEVFRTFRKYYASAIAISQTISDFSKSKIAGAILPNCSIKWLLMQQQSDPGELKEVLGLNENETSLVKSLYQDKGRFSEAFLMAQKDRSVVLIESTPLEYWIATTDPKDLAKVEAITKEKSDMNHLECLEFLSEKYPRGVSAAEKEKG